MVNSFEILRTMYLLTILLFVGDITIDIVGIRHNGAYSKIFKSKNFRDFIGKQLPILVWLLLSIMIVINLINLFVVQNLFSFTINILVSYAIIMAYLAIEKIGRYALWK